VREHAWEDGLGDAERGQTVDVDYVGVFRKGSLGERYGDAV